MTEVDDEFDAETLGLMVGYAGRDVRKPGEVTRTVLYLHSDESWTLPEFLALIERIAAEIPVVRRNAARVEFNTGYYDSGTTFTISYSDTETEEEVAENVSRFLDYVRENKARERAAYERLKAKFG